MPRERSREGSLAPSRRMTHWHEKEPTCSPEVSERSAFFLTSLGLEKLGWRRSTKLLLGDEAPSRVSSISLATIITLPSAIAAAVAPLADVRAAAAAVLAHAQRALVVAAVVCAVPAAEQYVALARVQRAHAARRALSRLAMGPGFACSVFLTLHARPSVTSVSAASRIS